MPIIDLSAPIAPSPEGTPPFLKIDVEYNSHAHGAQQAQALLRVTPDLFRNDEGWATETITRLGTHDSTHVDAPGTTMPPFRASPPKPLTNCRWNGFSVTALNWT